MLFKRIILDRTLRKLLEKGFTLNKTEFIAYLTCPFQFYIMKDLNKQTSYGLRYDFSDYETPLREGIENHNWLQMFHQTYGADIQSNTYPKLIDEDRKCPWKMDFVDFEINRFKQDPDFWEPLAVELYIQDDSLCGKIDRIDRVDDQGNCRIVEYKSYPNRFDEEELLFYAVLLRNQLPHQELSIIKEVSELGIYYYKLNEFNKAHVMAEILDSYEEYIKVIRMEMIEPQSIKKKKDCHFATTRCLFRDICQRINIKHQKIIGLSK